MILKQLSTCDRPEMQEDRQSQYCRGINRDNRNNLQKNNEVE